jgi:hypothetical protein
MPGTEDLVFREKGAFVEIIIIIEGAVLLYQNYNAD